MATFTCPDGHDSTAGDYCDVCGAPISGAGDSGAAPSGTAPSGTAPPGAGLTPPPLPPATAGRTCPNCSASNIGGALFCESCGYDFTTGQLPRPLDPPSGLTLDPPSGSVAAAAAAVTPPSGSAPSGSAAGADPVCPPSGSAVAAPASPPDVDAVSPWVVEIWVDADWYAGQDVPEACPSPGMPTIVVLRERSVLVGRRSVSRGISPEIEISGDTGVSRRHAQLTTDGQRWWVEDLQSANGTYLGAAGKPLPDDPITPGQRVELAEDGRIYVGGWTRLVVREATPGDLIAPYGP